MEDKQRKQPKVYTCTYCNYTAKNNIIFQTHCKTKKHKTFVRQANFTPFCIQNAQSWQPNDTKEKQIYNCELCKFSTTKKYNYDTHILTIKHKQKEDTNFKSSVKIYRCENCNREYDIYQSLWKHKKSCIFQGSQEPQNKTIKEISLSRPPSSASVAHNETDPQEESDSESENFTYIIDDTTGDEYCYKYTNKTELEEYEDIYNRMYKNYIIYSEIDTDTDTDTDTESNIDIMEEEPREPNPESKQIVSELLYDLVDSVIDYVSKIHNEKTQHEKQKEKTDNFILPDEISIGDEEYTENEYSDEEYTENEYSDEEYSEENYDVIDVDV